MFHIFFSLIWNLIFVNFVFISFFQETKREAGTAKKNRRIHRQIRNQRSSKSEEKENLIPLNEISIPLNLIYKKRQYDDHFKSANG